MALADLHRDIRCNAAVMQGDRKTSAPIAAKLGFKEVCSIDLYGWSGT